MDSIKIFNRSIPNIGYVARTNTQGEEFELVNSYISYLYTKYKNLKNKKIAIFIEPQIDTGYPDLVIIEYYDCSKNIWNEERFKLTINDLKILYQIQKDKQSSIKDLSDLLGFSLLEIKKSFVRLSNCHLIHLSKNGELVRNVQLHTYCHINKIISIEAKINKWSDAIRQATKNIWFSTDSFILMNKNYCNNMIIEQCKQHGIGIILVNGNVKCILECDQRKFPVSYVSFLFNEWIQRNDHLKESQL